MVGRSVVIVGRTVVAASVVVAVSIVVVSSSALSAVDILLKHYATSSTSSPRIGHE